MAPDTAGSGIPRGGRLVSQSTASNPAALWVFSAAGLLLFLRISVPQSLVAGFFPGPETPGALITEMSETFEIMTYAASPVFPSSGLVAVLAAVLWVVGALFVWGASGGPVAAMSLPSLGLYLQFAVIDRLPGGRGWMGAAAATFALAMAAIANDRRSSAGRVRDSDGRPMPRRGGSLALAMAGVVAIASVAVAGAATDVVSETGTIQWRTGGGYGPGSGGIRFDRSVDLRQRLISRTNAELFRATLDDNAPPANQIYWRLETLGRYDGESWLPVIQPLNRYAPSTAGGDSEHEYRGSTTTFTQNIQIAALRGPLAPTAGIAQALQSDTESLSQFQVADDGSLVIQSQLDEGMRYQLEATYPLERADFNALATGSDGQLTPLFADATSAGAVDVEPAQTERDVTRPSDISSYVELPDDLPDTIGELAREQTQGARSDFERATLLQYFFRDSGSFAYTLDVDPGHSDLQLEDWLTDPESPNYRAGYCEQFAASMAVLGRSLGIPSRVVMGFTPGETIEQSNGIPAVIVRDNNAHAWVEMWMDGFGWVRFDPTPRSDGANPQAITAGFDPTQYVAEPLDGPQTIDQPGFDSEGNIFGLDETDLGGPGIGAGTGAFPWWILLIPALLLVGSMVPVYKGIRRRRRLHEIRNGDITAAWDEIVDQLSDLGEEIPEHQTPYEFAIATDRSLVPVATAYGAAIYGGHDGRGREEDFQAVESWIKLRYEGGKRLRARFNPTSLIRRNGRR